MTSVVTVQATRNWIEAFSTACFYGLITGIKNYTFHNLTIQLII